MTNLERDLNIISETEKPVFPVESSHYLSVLKIKLKRHEITEKDYNNAIKTYEKECPPPKLERTTAKDIGERVSDKPMAANAVRKAKSRLKKRLTGVTRKEIP
jgi:hypothetical protein